jgi:hypothetical protein
VDREQARVAIIASIPHGARQNAAAYMAEGSFAENETLSVDRRPYIVPAPAFLGFVDLQPGRNWSHDCLYIWCRIANDTVEVQPGAFPPGLPEHRRLILLSAGPEVPPWAIAGDKYSAD